MSDNSCVMCGAIIPEGRQVCPICENNPYWKRITKVADNQRSKGIREYGKGIEDDTAEINIRINRIEEELIDALMYLEHLRDKINEGGDDLK